MLISTTDLATVTGGAPSNTNNLAAWLPSGGGSPGGGLTSQDIMNAKPVDNRVIEQPGKNPFPSPDMRVTSPQDNSWMNRIPDMFRQLGMP